MFEHLGSHRRVVVTGPQRSGTRIAAQMIAADTGHRYVDEFDFGVYDAALFRRWLAVKRPVVVHAPTMLKDVVDNPPPSVFVVLMRRPLADIHASEERIDWEGRLRGNSAELAKFGLNEGDSAQVKYTYWDSHAKRFPYLELDYESLRGHPRWVEADERRDFGPLQTAPSPRSQGPGHDAAGS